MIVPSTLKGIVGRGGLLLQKHSPEILTGVGIAGVVVAAVLGARATLRLEEVVSDIEDRKDLLNDMKSEGTSSDSEIRKETAYFYLHATGEFIKLYGPAVSLGAASIVSIVAAHGILQKRNVALVAAYKGIESAFAEYRKRVAEKIGEEQERDVYYGVRETTVTNPDTGKKTKEYSIEEDPNKLGPYAKFFDEFNVNFQKDPEYNLLFLRNKQNYANDLLRARGHIFLNEVYDSIGIEHTKAGAVVGWAVSEEGDNFVDFGIYDPDRAGSRRFVNGDERAIRLDFNVDGVILDKI